MACEKTNCNKKEVIVGNTTFAITLTEVCENVYDLACTPCNVPTSVYCVCRITVRENCCNNMRYYQSQINSDPVVTIQDCNLEDIIVRSIEEYFSNLPTFSTGNNNNNCCCNSGLFF